MDKDCKNVVDDKTYPDVQINLNKSTVIKKKEVIKGKIRFCYKVAIAEDRRSVYLAFYHPQVEGDRPLRLNYDTGKKEAKETDSI